MRVGTEGIDLEDRGEPLIDLRFADDSLVFATSSQQLAYMHKQFELNSNRCTTEKDTVDIQTLLIQRRSAKLIAHNRPPQPFQFHPASALAAWLRHAQSTNANIPCPSVTNTFQPLVERPVSKQVK